MNMNEEQFFHSVKSSFEGFQPEVPAHIYAGIQEKMKEKRKGFFLGWSLNAWLILLGITGLSALVIGTNSSSDVASQHKSPDFDAANIYMIEKAHRSIEFINSTGNKSDEMDEEIAEEAISCKMMANTKSCSPSASSSKPINENVSASNQKQGTVSSSSIASQGSTDAIETSTTEGKTEVGGEKSLEEPLILPVVVKKKVEKEKESENND